MLENADDFGQGILKIGQGKVREFCFMKFVGTLIWFPASIKRSDKRIMSFPKIWFPASIKKL